MSILQLNWEEGKIKYFLLKQNWSFQFLSVYVRWILLLAEIGDARKTASFPGFTYISRHFYMLVFVNKGKNSLH